MDINAENMRSFLTEKINNSSLCIVTKTLNYKIKEIIDKLKPIESENNEKLLREILKRLKIGEEFKIKQPIINSKNVEASLMYRYQGNEYFKLDELNESFNNYTKSVAYAPRGSQELGIAYANRSAVLFSAKFMADSIKDINHALMNNYPDNLKSKLYFRKVKCLKALSPDDHPAIEDDITQARQWLKKMDEKNRQVMEKNLMELEMTKAKTTEPVICFNLGCEEIVPKLKAENRLVPGLSDSVELKYSKEYGRHIVAARDIEPGEILGVQKPYATRIKEKMKYKICSHCGEQTWSSIPCNNCHNVIYCSKICQKKAQISYHDVECCVWPQLRAYGAPDTYLLALKMSIMAIKENGNSLECLKNHVAEIDGTNDPLKKGFTNDKLDPEKYASVYGLSTHCHLENDRESANWVLSCIAAYFLAKKIKLIENLPEDLRIMGQNDDFIFLAAFVYKNIMIISINTFQIMFPYENNDSEKVGCTILPAFSFFNHSCVPMITRCLHSNHLIYTSLCPIKKGEQIFETYTPFYYEVGILERRQFIKNWSFICKCEACCNDWKFDFWIAQRLSKRLVLNSPNSASIYMKKNNKLLDLSKDMNKCIKLIKKSHDLGKKNSFQVIKATDTLIKIIFDSQKPLLSLETTA